MTKAELIELLAGVPDDAPVFVKYYENEGGVVEDEVLGGEIKTIEYPDIEGAEPYKEVILKLTYS